MDKNTHVLPDFNNMLWRCPCCDTNRNDKFIKTYSHDVSVIIGLETGTMFINVKYCADVPGCKDKAFDRDWVIKKFLPRLEKDEV